MDIRTTEQVKIARNPKGKGGFAENPQNINIGGRPKNNESISYWYRMFLRMTITDFNSWKQCNPDNLRTIASELAYERVVRAKDDLKEFQEITDRTEGKAVQMLQQTSEVTLEPSNKIEPILSKEEKIKRIKDMVDALNHTGEYSVCNLDPKAIIK